MSTWIVPELGRDFNQDEEFEKRIIEYIYNQWSIADPAKPAAMEGQNEIIKFHVGFFDYFYPYEVTALQTSTTPTMIGEQDRRYQLATTIDIGMRMKRLDKFKPDPQLGNMEREVMRIGAQYVQYPQDLPGIKKTTYAGQERVYNASDSYAKTDWRSVVRLSLWYEKVNLL